MTSICRQLYVFSIFFEQWSEFWSKVMASSPVRRRNIHCAGHIFVWFYFVCVECAIGLLQGGCEQGAEASEGVSRCVCGGELVCLRILSQSWASFCSLTLVITISSEGAGQKQFRHYLLLASSWWFLQSKTFVSSSLFRGFLSLSSLSQRVSSRVSASMLRVWSRIARCRSRAFDINLSNEIQVKTVCAWHTSIS